MALQRYTKPTNTFVPKSEFKLIGEVIRMTDNQTLIRKLNAKNTFWIINPKNSWGLPLELGKTYCFTITISTYIDKEDIIRTKLWGRDCYEYDLDDTSEETEGFLGLKSGTIEDYFATDISSLKIVTFKLDSGETFYLRFFSDKDPVVGEYKLYLDLRSTTKLINTDGNVWEDPYTYTDKNGNEVQSRKGFPSLEIKDFISE